MVYGRLFLSHFGTWKICKENEKKIVCREKKHIYYKYITNIISKNDQTDGDASGYLLYLKYMFLPARTQQSKKVNDLNI